MSIFSDMGRSEAVRKISASEEGQPIPSSFKTISFKCPDHLAHLLDHFASYADVSRTEILIGLLTSSLSPSICDYIEAYNNELNSSDLDQFALLQSCSDFSEGLDPSVKSSFMSSVAEHLGLS